MSVWIGFTTPPQIEAVCTTGHFMPRSDAMVPPVHAMSVSNRLPSSLASMSCTFVTIAGPFATRPQLFESGKPSTKEICVASSG